MKYGYHFMDWGLFDIEEIQNIKELKEDLVIKDAFGEHVYNKEDWVLVTATKEIFFHPYYDGEKMVMHRSCVGPYLKDYIFDTEEEARAYGEKHSSCTFF